MATDSRIKLLRHATNQHLGGARNTGASHANEDVALLALALLAPTIYLSPVIVYNYVKRPSSISNQQNQSLIGPIKAYEFTEDYMQQHNLLPLFAHVLRTQQITHVLLAANVAHQSSALTPAQITQTQRLYHQFYADRPFKLRHFTAAKPHGQRLFIGLLFMAQKRRLIKVVPFRLVCNLSI